MKLQVIKTFAIETPQSRGQQKQIVIETGRFFEGIAWCYVPSHAKQQIEADNHDAPRKVKAEEAFVVYLMGRWILLSEEYVKIAEYRRWFRVS